MQFVLGTTPSSRRSSAETRDPKRVMVGANSLLSGWGFGP
jgi:hypothetical protein